MLQSSGKIHVYYFEGRNRKLLVLPLTLRWYTFRIAGRSQTLVSSLKWHIYWFIAVFTACLAAWTDNVGRAYHWRTAIDELSCNLSANDRRKQESGTSKFGKVPFNCAVSSPFDQTVLGNWCCFCLILLIIATVGI